MANGSSDTPPPAGQATLPATGTDPQSNHGTSADAHAVLDEVGIRRALMRIAHEIAERNEDLDRLYLVAIPNGGGPLGRRLVENLREVAQVEPPLGILDTTLYRDDLGSTGSRPLLRETEMPSSVDEAVVILVEDVVSTGRTIRAAMDALMDFGRPRAVQVVALVDRGHRELPIKIDFVGKNIPTRVDEKVKLRGLEGDLEGPLEVVVQGRPAAQETAKGGHA